MVQSNFLFAKWIEYLFNNFKERISDFTIFIRYLNKAKSYLSEKSLAALKWGILDSCTVIEIYELCHFEIYEYNSKYTLAKGILIEKYEKYIQLYHFLLPSN